MNCGNQLVCRVHFILLATSLVLSSFVAANTKCEGQVTTSITCTVVGDDNGNTNCAEIIQRDPDDGNCFLDVKHDFEWCNLMSDETVIPLQNQKTNAKIIKTNINNFDKSPISPNSCKETSDTRKINVCEPNFYASLKIEGTLESNQFDFCYSYRHLFHKTKPAAAPDVCLSSASVECKTLPDGKPCADLVIDPAICGPYQVSHTFTYCNDNDEGDIRLLEAPTKALDDGTEVIIDESQMEPDECRQKTIVSDRNSCDRPYSFYASIKTEGWKLPQRPLDRYCYAYDFLKTKPTIVGGECDVSASISCKVKGTNISCEDVARYPPECGSTQLEYTFEACNANEFDPINFRRAVVKVDGAINNVASNAIASSDNLGATLCASTAVTKTVNTCNAFNANIFVNAINRVTKERTCKAEVYFNMPKPVDPKEPVVPTSAPTFAPLEECLVTSKLTCTVASDGSDCEDIAYSNTLGCDVSVKFQYEFCNKSPSLPANLRNSVARALNKNVAIPKWGSLLSDRCRSKTIFRKVNRCVNNRISAQLKVQGNLSNDERCYAFDSINVKIEANECDLIITEIVDPADKTNGRYVELYSSKCAGETIKEDLWLIQWRQDKVDPSTAQPVNLKGLTIGPDGYLLICNSNQGNEIYGNLCDVIGGFGSPANSNGDDQVAIIKGTFPSTDFEIMDIFGIPGEDGTGTNHDFTDGRAVRKTSITTPKSIWDPNDWYVIPGLTPGQILTTGDMDPRQWFDIPMNIIITEIVDPLMTPIQSRFVELHTTDTSFWSSKKPITDELKLVMWRGDNEEPTWEYAVNLEGRTFDKNGFMVLCNRNSAQDTFNGKCNYIVGVPGPADSNGDDQIAIVQGDESDYVIVDIFGVPGEDGTDTDHEFTDGRAVRKLNVIYPKKVWDVNDWYIYNDRLGTSVGPREADPGIWADPTLSTSEPTLSPIEMQSPTMQPTVSSAPTGGFCDKKIFITELADPKNDEAARFVSLYSPKCANRKITDELWLINWTDDNSDPENVPVSLNGMTIGPDGFLVLCNMEGAQMTYNGKCDEIVGGNTPVDNDGNNAVAIVDGNFPFRFDIVDIYGYPGEDSEGSLQDFTDGRAVRIPSATMPKNSWSPDDWIIVKGGQGHGVLSDDLDPRVWDQSVPLHMIITEIADPLDGRLSRYVELYSNNYAGKVITDNLWLVRWTEDSLQPSAFKSVHLKGMTISDDGFILICNRDEAQVSYSGKCDMIAGWGSPADCNGDDQIGIIRGNPRGTFTIVDLFGVPGEDGSGTDHDFSNGRAMRKTTAIDPKQIWDVNDWIVVSGSTTKDDLDPRIWEEAECNLDLIITEIADPKQTAIRFIELYSECGAGNIIDEDLYLFRWTDDSSDPDETTYIPLKGILIKPDGFLVFCNNFQAFNLLRGKCDVFGGIEGPADSNGDDTIAIVRGPIFNYSIYDIYGIPGGDAITNGHAFTDGRAVRKLSVTSPKTEWDPEDWTIVSGIPPNLGATLSQCDPHEWNIAATPIPTTSPTRSPVISAPSKGKGSR